MEEKLLCKDCDNELIKDLSVELVEAGYKDGEYYFKSSDYRCPFFKISKHFKKEREIDPEIQYIFNYVGYN